MAAGVFVQRVLQLCAHQPDDLDHDLVFLGIEFPKLLVLLVVVPGACAKAHKGRGC